QALPAACYGMFNKRARGMVYIRSRLASRVAVAATRAAHPAGIYPTAVGKKYAMAISGIVLMAVLLGHMVGHLNLYFGARRHHPAVRRRPPARPHRGAGEPGLRERRPVPQRGGELAALAGRARLHRREPRAGRAPLPRRVEPVPEHGLAGGPALAAPLRDRVH